MVLLLKVITDDQKLLSLRARLSDLSYFPGESCLQLASDSQGLPRGSVVGLGRGNFIINSYKIKSWQQRPFAYIDYNAWGSGVILPINHGTDQYTDGNEDCPLVMMLLRAQDKSWHRGLFHIKSDEILAETKRLTEALAEKRLHLHQLIYSPWASTAYHTALNLLEKVSLNPIRLIMRSSPDTARGLLTNEGWTLQTHYNYPVFHQELWKKYLRDSFI